jgi:Protein of unknown function (DUF664)
MSSFPVVTESRRAGARDREQFVAQPLSGTASGLDRMAVGTQRDHLPDATSCRIQRATGDNRPMGTIERPLPPLNADERTTLESWLDFHRATLAMKCEGLDDEQAAVASVPPSGFTLTGLVQHMAEVERNWFRRVLAGEQAPPIYDPQPDPHGPDGGFELAEGVGDLAIPQL